MFKSKVANIILIISIGLILLVVASYLILVANGYKINWQTKKIQKTGMIYLKSDPRDVEIYLDGKIQGEKTPLRISYLLPKRYTIEFKKAQYQNWGKTVQVETGQVEVYQSIVLFKEKPVISQATEEEKKLLTEAQQNNHKSDLLIKNNEIWWGEDFITRMSDSIKKTSWWTDKNHILFQIKNEIHVMDLDGSNNLILVKLTSEATSAWILRNSGKDLLYQDNGTIKKAEIR